MMTLKDRINEALAATPADNTHRLETLNAALNAGDDETDIAAALERLIEAREQKASAFELSGQPTLAKNERDEAAHLRTVLLAPSATLAGGRSLPRANTVGERGALISRKQLLIGGGALLAAAAALLLIFNPFGQGDDASAPANDKVSVFKDDHTIGDPKAPIKLVEYASPSCPHCAHFALNDFPKLKREFIDTGRVFYIFRVFPIHAPDGAVEGIARCLPANRYFPYLDHMFRNLAEWYSPETKDIEGSIIRLAAAEGVSPERAKQCMTDPSQQERINQLSQDGLIRYQLDHTPTFVMDGQVVNVPEGQTILDVLRLRINSLTGTKP